MNPDDFWAHIWEREEVEAADLPDALQGKTIASARPMAYGDDEPISWIEVRFTDGTGLLLSAGGMHTEGWIYVRKLNHGDVLR